MEILRLENLCKTYGNEKNSVVALNNVSLRIQKGEFIAITGPSGSGKSTLLHLLSGVDTPTSGEIFVDGKNMLHNSREEMAIFRRRQIGLIYQFYNLIPTLTVEKNIALPLLLDGHKINHSYLSELIKTLRLEDIMHRLPKELSGGQQQRVAIGRALMNTPAIVLADEPTGNLDRRASQDILELLKYTNKKYHQTMILVTHDHDIAAQASRFIEMTDGKIISDKVII